MTKFTTKNYLFAFLTSLFLLTACGNGASTEGLKVKNWGPQSTIVNKVPNTQPDGSAGIWIKFSGDIESGDAELSLSGQPAKITVVKEGNFIQSGLITAAVSAELFSQPGDKEVVVKQLSTGKIFKIGVLKVEAEKLPSSSNSKESVASEKK